MHRDHRTSFTPRPLAQLAAALAVGIMAAHRVPVSPKLLTSCAVLLYTFLIWSLRKRHHTACSILLIVITVFAGTPLAAVEQRGAPADQIKQLFEVGAIAPGDPVELTGVMSGPAEIAPESLYLKLRVERIRFKSVERSASGVVELLAPVRDQGVRTEYEGLELRYGARLRVMTQLERTDTFRNPGVSSF